MRLLKVGIVPAKADLEKQQTFKKKSLNPDPVKGLCFLQMQLILFSAPS